MCSEKIQKIPAPKRVPENPPGPAGGGFVKIFRKITKSEVFQDAELLKTWLWCICQAQYQPVTESVRIGRGSVRVHLEPGQFIYQRAAAARELGSKPTTVYQRIKRLERMGSLMLQSDNQFTVVSLVNWITYQAGHDGGRQVNDKFNDNQTQVFDDNQTEQRGGTGASEKRNKNDCLKKLCAVDGKGNSGGDDNQTEALNDRLNDSKKYIQEVLRNPPKSPLGADGWFDSFWQEYPRKVAKQAALRAWKKTAAIRPPLPEVLAALEAQKASDQWTRDGGRFIPHPATWLNAGRWDDEVENHGPEDDGEFFRPYLRGEMQ